MSVRFSHLLPEADGRLTANFGPVIESRVLAKYAKAHGYG